MLPFLFILGAEILASKTKQSKNVSEVHIYQHEFKSSQFADDTSLLCKDIMSVENAITIINEFGVISGLTQSSQVKGTVVRTIAE